MTDVVYRTRHLKLDYELCFFYVVSGTHRA